MALIEHCAGISPEGFDAGVRSFFAAARHRDRGVPLSEIRYQPMLELLDELDWANVFAADLAAR